MLAPIVEGLSSDDRLIRLRATFAFIGLSSEASYLVYRRGDPYLAEMKPAHAQQIVSVLRAMLRSADPPSVYAASQAWQLDATDVNLLRSVPFSAEGVLELFEAWRAAATPRLAQCIAQTLSVCTPIDPLLLQGHLLPQAEIADFLEDKFSSLFDLDATGTLMPWEAKAAVLMGWYWRAPWREEQLVLMIDTLYQIAKTYLIAPWHRYAELKRATSMLLALGQAGKDKVAEREEELKKLENSPF
jgi:hypothetical protein